MCPLILAILTMLILYWLSGFKSYRWWTEAVLFFLLAHSFATLPRRNHLADTSYLFQSRLNYFFAGISILVVGFLIFVLFQKVNLLSSENILLIYALLLSIHHAHEKVEFKSNYIRIGLGFRYVNVEYQEIKSYSFTNDVLKIDIASESFVIQLQPTDESCRSAIIKTLDAKISQF
jgi:hypothetical protein